VDVLKYDESHNSYIVTQYIQDFPQFTCIFISFLCITLITFHFSKAIGSYFLLFTFGGFLSLYGTLVCVACSQLEKLKLALLDIRQTHVISEQHCEAEPGKIVDYVHTSEELFLHMQKQLNECIRHHQEVKR
jgi:hypothetical protein